MLMRLFFQIVVISSLVGCGFIKQERPVEPVVELDPKLEGRVKLINAISSKDIPLIEQLIREGASVNPPVSCIRLNPYVPPIHKASPLVAAISAGDFGIVKMLVSAGADVNAEPSACGNPLVRAVRESLRDGQLEIVRYLIEHGADVNRFEDDETTPLRMALRYATNWETNYELVVLLVEHGANVNQTVVPEPFDISSVFWPTCSNVYSGRHSTPLHEAVFILRVDISKYLLERGANPKAKDGNGRTAADCARARLKIIRVPELRPAIEAQIELLTQYEQKH